MHRLGKVDGLDGNFGGEGKQVETAQGEGFVSPEGGTDRKSEALLADEQGDFLNGDDGYVEPARVPGTLDGFNDKRRELCGNSGVVDPDMRIQEQRRAESRIIRHR